MLLSSAGGRVIDSGRRRWADAHRPNQTASKRFAGYGRIYAYTVPLLLDAKTPLHSELASQAARAVCSTLFGDTPAHWKLEDGETVGLHLHVTTPTPPRCVNPDAYTHVQVVTTPRKWFAYLAKPADARLCRPTPYQWATTTKDERRARLNEGLQERAAARAARIANGYARLPTVSGWTGRAPSQPSPLLRLQITNGLLLLALLVTNAVLGLLAPERHDERRRAPTRHKPLPRPLLGLWWPATNRHRRKAPPPAAGGGCGRTLCGL